MSLSLDPIWLLAFLLVFVRALAWLTVVPPFSNRNVIPAPARIGIAGGLGILAVNHVPVSSIPTDTASLIGSIVLQIFSGVMLGLPVMILLSSIGSAGAMIDLFGGLNLPPSIDPMSLNQTPILGQFYNYVGIVLLFVTNGEMLLVHGFTESLGRNDVMLSPSGFGANVITADVATYFTATLEIAAPLIAVLFATQIGLALLAKAAPQMNVWVLGFPIQAILSLAFVGIGIHVLPTFLVNILGRISQDMTALVNGH
ncbi:MAG TPA: flagellar biosynthetic protein FliR [Acidimicrobiales bacterium]|nr:flagellar biosynthetic protein FliR [Acidimicrobiales bacterium]